MKITKADNAMATATKLQQPTTNATNTTAGAATSGASTTTTLS